MMKAVINGIEVEGTPDEIIEYQRLDAIEKHKKSVNMLVGDVKLFLVGNHLIDLIYDTE